MAASERLTRALQQRLGDELSKELFTWMVQMESNGSELKELHGDFLKFVVQTNRRFDSVGARFDRVDARLAGIDVRFGHVEAKLDVLDHKLVALIEKRHTDLLQLAFIFWCGSTFGMAALVLAAR
jgi:hypothetical protein